VFESSVLAPSEVLQDQCLHPRKCCNMIALGPKNNPSTPPQFYNS
jgi:hypothetical protein